uniref:uncharacterized protein si:ch211-250c4.3 isoform X2 n=1 Tax=Doryrhamphus excisus TaxID=161450 RepID=UPI0025AE6C05|nr:uncharacterized protein si:ch211-250c4.3 isoform X2 [Doryrhamphus excisus]
MSGKMKRSGMVLRWRKSFSILAPWRKGKDGDTVMDRTVVLTKMKLLSNVTERLLMADDSSSSCSTASEQKMPPRSKDSSPDSLSGQRQADPAEKYLSAILSGSQLSRLYKFQSEDSGVELSSGANSPSTPTGSEQNFMVHSRESSCDSCHLKSDGDQQTRRGRRPASPALDADLHIGEVQEIHGFGVSPRNLKDTDKLEENTEEEFTDKADTETESLKGSATCDGLDQYMDQCCRLSQVQQSGSNPLGSGLGYLEHICQLVERIGHLQETNLQLQKQICRLQKDGGMTKTKEDFFRHHCCCGAASLAFQDKSQAWSPGGTLRDLSSIPEATQHQLHSTREDMSGLIPEPLWRRSDHFHTDRPEGLPTVYRPMRDYHTLGRVKDLVKRTKLGLSSTSLKTSCPQLYRPDLGREDLAGRNRNSMIVLGHHGKVDIPWLQ